MVSRSSSSQLIADLYQDRSHAVRIVTRRSGRVGQRGHKIVNHASGCMGFLASGAHLTAGGTAAVWDVHPELDWSHYAAGGLRRSGNRSDGGGACRDLFAGSREVDAREALALARIRRHVSDGQPAPGSVFKHGPSCACYCVYGNGELNGSLPTELVEHAERYESWSRVSPTLLAAKLFLGIEVPQDFRFVDWVVQVLQDTDDALEGIEGYGPETDG
ncbi:hypothetical protein BKA67DRAFT_534082 [Truncatella angustata]|uniref:Uncharacterized protein n=1 Tax=Truncatella angustata TaxID=152316 RepID=A0A9P8UNH0_9PEZI|nr:uncharacterized protein BKA67DRAFT_534082 [Truncatella angustata]KAH6655144.1 hypothetical protein BKA67DRAFT_534082 [Truncatella angustata]KAH8200430.1 hypothetical protein TruAng_005393 [Truncatella angustata]